MTTSLVTDRATGFTFEHNSDTGEIRAVSVAPQGVRPASDWLSHPSQRHSTSPQPPRFPIACFPVELAKFQELILDDQHREAKCYLDGQGMFATIADLPEIGGEPSNEAVAFSTMAQHLCSGERTELFRGALAQ